MLTPEKIQQMKDQLKTGIKTVSAPQLFPTPALVARKLVQLATINNGDGILEPSAGTGRILDEIIAQTMRFDQCELVAVELNIGLVSGLKAKYQTEIFKNRMRVIQDDFLEHTGYYDKIIMNPPFENGKDIKHITHALSLLRKGGRLVAICAAGPRQIKAFENYETIKLDAGTFKDEGTNVNTMMVIIDK